MQLFFLPLCQIVISYFFFVALGMYLWVTMDTIKGEVRSKGATYALRVPV